MRHVTFLPVSSTIHIGVSADDEIINFFYFIQNYFSRLTTHLPPTTSSPATMLKKRVKATKISLRHISEVSRYFFNQIILELTNEVDKERNICVW